MKPGLVTASVLAAWPALAAGQSAPPDRASAPSVATEGIASSGPIGSSARGGALDWLVLPTGFDLGGALRYAMSPAGALGERPLRFTDLGLLDLHTRFGLGHGVEVGAASTVLVKQPSDADEPVWQGATLGLRWQPSPRKRYVIGVAATGGPMLDDRGSWAGGGLSLASRKRLIGDATGGIQFEGALAADGTFLRPDAGPVTSLAEARTELGLLFHGGKPGKDGGGFAMWLSSSYALPVWHRGDDLVSGADLDPQSRLGFAIGAMGSLLDTWDLIVELRMTDRGDLPFAPTRLPILDGGFDLRQLVFGVTYHGRYPSNERERDPLIMIP